ncbi:hypothetical protein SBA5_1060004 [Candidatus Sulfotelmatomonas gaucii]|uniref:Uncharacterized protein n=1 Tax=Candidatus Sulfuritelmatomonas gaucii TaxID=2043161 RepID=A0A2N9L2Q3_9BACT|nr:hypothetical protein SBA5_1060004 [Candidatus Sulfotelmatomonas gaucii]
MRADAMGLTPAEAGWSAKLACAPQSCDWGTVYRPRRGFWRAREQRAEGREQGSGVEPTCFRAWAYLQQLLSRQKLLLL